jgi:hypothetical protein
MYRFLKDTQTNEIFGAIRNNMNGTMTSFVFDPDNTDYQEYLKWLAESPDNIPLPADGDSNGI